MRQCCMLCVTASCLFALTACTRVQTATAQADLASPEIPSPADVIGHPVGADFKLARWETIVRYFDQLHKASDRVNVRRLDTTTEGNPYLSVEISSVQTMRQLDRYRALQSKLADPRLINNATERARLLRNAKTTIVLTCSLHSSECAGSQMAMELAYDLAAGNDARTLEILDNCIILLVPSANPDGNNKIIDWYEPYINTPYEGGRMPWLYHKYAGHDTNRDWFMLSSCSMPFTNQRWVTPETASLHSIDAYWHR